MKKCVLCVAFLISFSLIFSANMWAADKATPAEVIQKVNEAVDLILEKGEEAAFTVFRDKNGPFVWKDTYLYVIGFDGIMLMHPYVPAIEGRDQLPVKDAKGKLFNAEQLAIAKGPGHGWIDYWWIKPNEKKASPKVSYIKAVPGKNMWVGSGVYDITKEEAEKAGK